MSGDGKPPRPPSGSDGGAGDDDVVSGPSTPRAFDASSDPELRESLSRLIAKARLEDDEENFDEDVVPTARLSSQPIGPLSTRDGARYDEDDDDASSPELEVTRIEMTHDALAHDAFEEPTGARRMSDVDLLGASGVTRGIARGDGDEPADDDETAGPAARHEPEPGSSRRPVLPSDTAPVLPDVDAEFARGVSSAPPRFARTRSSLPPSGSQVSEPGSGAQSSTNLLGDDRRDDASRDDVSRDDVSRDDVSRDNVSRDDLSRDDASRDDVSRSARRSSSSRLSRAASTSSLHPPRPSAAPTITGVPEAQATAPTRGWAPATFGDWLAASLGL